MRRHLRSIDWAIRSASQNRHPAARWRERAVRSSAVGFKESRPLRADEVSNLDGKRSQAPAENPNPMAEVGRIRPLARASARESRVLSAFVRGEVFETAPEEWVHTERTGFRGLGLTGGKRPAPVLQSTGTAHFPHNNSPATSEADSRRWSAPSAAPAAAPSSLRFTRSFARLLQLLPMVSAGRPGARAPSSEDRLARPLD